ncbi:MAG: transcription antitermination factor NusB [Candidatus Neomarinimicrobiota bacterium]|jgi:N utilization substance protein B|nr:transcription antitermination factor NusB [Candidatus Neomarinimicrobiota bacterium]|tara:strand:+ start:313 stop:729 length:417 start_codon:yes stop_codon:yes gene_type:complete
MTNKQQRKKAREAVLQALYAIHLSQENEEKVLRDINERYNFDLATKEFIDELFRNTINDRKVLDAKIEGALENWDIERINVIDRLIMQMAICEMLSLKKYEIPYQVTISSAIENAKKFSSEDSTAFVNGILDTIHKTL